MQPEVECDRELVHAANAIELGIINNPLVEELPTATMEQAQRIIKKSSTMITAEELIKTAQFHVAGHLPRLQTRAPSAWNLAFHGEAAASNW